MKSHGRLVMLLALAALLVVRPPAVHAELGRKMGAMAKKVAITAALACALGTVGCSQQSQSDWGSESPAVQQVVLQQPVAQPTMASIMGDVILANWMLSMFGPAPSMGYSHFQVNQMLSQHSSEISKLQGQNSRLKATLQQVQSDRDSQLRSVKQTRAAVASLSTGAATATGAAKTKVATAAPPSRSATTRAAPARSSGRR